MSLPEERRTAGRIVGALFDFIEGAGERLGKWASFLVFIMMCVTSFEVVSRYVFNHPTSFAWPINRQLFGAFILFAGVYNMKNGGHIRIEIFYDRFPPPVKFVARIVALVAFVGFMGVLVWQGGWMGLNSLSMREVAAGAFRIPMYPFKLLIPIAAILFLVEGLIVFIRKRD